LETTTPVIKLLQTHDLDLAATGIGVWEINDSFPNSTMAMVFTLQTWMWEDWGVKWTLRNKKPVIVWRLIGFLSHVLLLFLPLLTTPAPHTPHPKPFKILSSSNHGGNWTDRWRSCRPEDRLVDVAEEIGSYLHNHNCPQREQPRSLVSNIWFLWPGHECAGHSWLWSAVKLVMQASLK
jgi:hypothetical protein